LDRRVPPPINRYARDIAGILTAGVILLLQDLDRPCDGFIAVSQQPKIDVATILASYSE
jgi:hypothetical protein